MNCNAPLGKRRFAIFVIVFFIFFLYSRISIAQEEEKTVTFKIVLVNPADAEPQTIPLKVPLPQDVTPDNIVDLDELEIGYDRDSSVYYVHKEIEVASGETLTYDIVVKDIWIIKEEKLKDLSDRMEEVLVWLKQTKYAAEAGLLREETINMIDQIRKDQEEEYSDVEDHVKAYQLNSILIGKVKKIVGTLEAMVEESKGPSLH